MSRFTLPRDIYHGKGALEALKTLENNIERGQAGVNKRKCIVLENKTMVYVLLIAFDLLIMILYCIIMKLLDMQIAF